MPASTIPDKPVEADSVLLDWCAAALGRLGADVRIREHAENSVRALAPARPFAAPAGADACGEMSQLARHVGPPVACIEVEGVPNLLHELVHIVLAGRLDDDHGFDYGAIPYDLSRTEGRAVLWNELAACVVSSAYMLPADPDAHARARVDAWFDEQLGIQPIFYGREHEPQAFFAALPELAHAYADELAAMLRCAYQRIAALLGWAGAPASVAHVARELDFDELWSRRERMRGAAA